MPIANQIAEAGLTQFAAIVFVTGVLVGIGIGAATALLAWGRDGRSQKVRAR